MLMMDEITFLVLCFLLFRLMPFGWISGESGSAVTPTCSHPSVWKLESKDLWDQNCRNLCDEVVNTFLMI